MTDVWRNWSGSASCRPRQYQTPETEDELQSIIADLEPSTRTVRVAGSGHSFPPVVPSGDVLLSLEDYTGIVDVDRDARQATVRAGTQLGDLNRELANHGLAMENLGDIDRQAIAGALSTGTHGTGIDLGILSTQVATMRLVTADGEILEVTPDDGDTFRAVQVSLGSLGVISTITLNLEPAYNLELETRPMPLEECLDSLPKLREANRHFEFFWFPYTETAFVKTMNKTDAEPTGDGGDFDSKAENLAWEGMCRLSTAFPGASKYMSKLAKVSFSEQRTVAPAHEMFAHQRDVTFNETEWSVPAAEGADALGELKDWIERSEEPVCFPVEFRYLAGDDIPLSPAYSRDSAMIAVHKYHRKSFETYFDAAASIFRKRDGRPHWGKLHELDATDVERMYPAYDEFRAVREDLDPEGMFLNDHLRELFEPTTATTV